MGAICSYLFLFFDELGQGLLFGAKTPNGVPVEISKTWENFQVNKNKTAYHPKNIIPTVRHGGSMVVDE